MDVLPKCSANYVPLTPLTFLKRAAFSYADRTSLIYEHLRFTWRQTYHRCSRLAAALTNILNVRKNDVVSVLAPNIPAVYEMHFAVPMARAVLNTINTRLDAHTVSTILRHSGTKILFVDCQFVLLARQALALLNHPIRLVIINDETLALSAPIGAGEVEYEHLISETGFADVDDQIMSVDDEWDPIALNYTSGTTSEPKGVVYSHRGAYLSTLSLILGWEMGSEPVYLWTLPMFHCNGWTFTWGIAARGGTNVCMRNPTAEGIYRNIAVHKVTHMCCAPIIFNILLEEENRIPLTSAVNILTGGAPPPAALLQSIESLGFHVTHAYGLTEATGPALLCEWQSKWNGLSSGDRARLKARQGINVLTVADVDVKDPNNMKSVAHDGTTMGEIMLRGSGIMKGYYKDPKATSDAFKGGWFFTGDVGVIHPDGYVEIKDRSKDVIISGGENISSIELEEVLYKHPRVLEAAVVAMPHPRWGESPCAFIAVKKNPNGFRGDEVTEAEIVSFCKKNVPNFMVPKKVEFLDSLPKTSTGKIQKFQLRALAKALVVTEKSVNKNNLKTQLPQQHYDHSQHQQQQILAQSRL
uniref:Benzoyl-CoA/cinnamoyl-CoA ligase n=1 Tax=Clarkia breweri TaxID=36903 RepID=I6N3H3_CLABR|nr:benzoyl-CoA/cinnamoyl-CoA ligase [Clarkia breweri]